MYFSVCKSFASYFWKVHALQTKRRRGGVGLGKTPNMETIYSKEKNTDKVIVWNRTDNIKLRLYHCSGGYSYYYPTMTQDIQGYGVLFGFLVIYL